MFLIFFQNVGLIANFLLFEVINPVFSPHQRYPWKTLMFQEFLSGTLG